MNRLIKHFKRWNKWRKHCGNGWLHKISVLFSGCSPTFALVRTDEEEEEIHRAVMRAIEEQEEHMRNMRDYSVQHRMTTKEAKDIIINDPNGDIVKRMEAIAVARSVLGEDATMEQIWRWAEGNVEEVTVMVRFFSCFECTEYVDIDGEQPRCGLDRDPLKCDRKVHGRKKESAI